MMKRLSLLMGLLALCFASAGADVSVSSPDGRLKVSVNVGAKITYDVTADGNPVMSGNEAAMILADGTVLGANPKLKSAKRSVVDEIVRPVVPLKKSEIRNHCNVLTLTFKGGYALEFRAYNEGVAYRFTTAFKNDIVINDETFTLNFDPESRMHAQFNSAFRTASEQPYQHPLLREAKADQGLINLPLLVETPNGYKVFLSEAGQYDYPGLFLRATGSGLLTGATPPNPLLKTDDAQPIAKVKGTRAYTWRYFAITKNDADLLTCTLNACLANPCKIADTSWIRPGQTCWDWWNGWDCYGPDVNFRAGINTETYKYYIDFAAQYKIPYMLIDDGWIADSKKARVVRSELNLPEVIRYGKSKGVGILLWFHWSTIDSDYDCLKYFADMGVAGMKIDFMDRHDQQIVNFYEKVVALAAENHLHIDFHGAYHPSGLEFEYPNLLSYEGVLGMEQEAGCTPDNTLYETFIRNVSGAMDYTPGAMISMQPECYHGTHPNHAAIGTRAYQMALYVALETGIQMLSDTPSNYLRNPDCTEYLSQVPVTWDDTYPLDARVGQYEVIAKRKGSDWWIGGITNHEERSLEVVLDFLEEGKEYELTAFADGVNAGRQAMHYVKQTLTVKKGTRLKIDMARNGGYAGVLRAK